VSRRLETGGTGIDRSKPLRFTFDGAEYQGFQGDTLASALLANGIVGGFRSPILGRPRGVMTDGTDEPNAFVAVLEPWVDLVAPATTVPLVEGLVAQARAGVADLADADPSGWRVRHAHRHVETLVVGGGDAGREAAREAAERGDRVLLLEERPRAIADEPGGEDLTVLTDTTALGLYDDGYVIVHERVRAAAGMWRVTVDDGTERVERTIPLPHGTDRIWHVRAGRVVLATGAFERPLAFVGNDRPGVMLASSAMRYFDRFGVLPGELAVAFVTNDWGLQAAERIANAGAELLELVDARDGRAVVRADGDSRVVSLTIREADGSETTIEADLLLVSGGWNPNLGLWRAIGGGLTYDEARACFVPDGAGPSWLSVVGAASGALPESAPLWFVEHGEDAEKYVDLQRDQTVSDVRAAVEAGLRSAAPLHAGVFRRPRGSPPRRPAGSHPHHAAPRVARRT
jgi:sarcosine oxidase subunit alpha